MEELSQRVTPKVRLHGIKSGKFVSIPKNDVAHSKEIWSAVSQPTEVPAGIPHLAPTEHKLQLLVVDDDIPILKACCEIAAGMGFAVHAASDAEQARRAVRVHSLDVVLMDLRMPGGGVSLLEEVRRVCPRSSVVIMTAFATVNSAVEAIRIGAADYLTKPFAMDELTSVLERAGQLRSFEIATQRVQGYVKAQGGVASLIGRSQEMEKLYRIISKVANANHSVLIQGESGSGKEMVARTIHESGSHASRRFVVLECSQVDPAVLAGELFGYARDASGASDRTHEPLLSSAEGGTVYLDDINELPLPLQAQLVRALREKEFTPDGAVQPVPVTVRLLAGSSRNLAQLVDSGHFRKDLYYRLNVVTLRIPPLRDRRDDIPLLAEYFLERIRQESDIQFRFAPDAMKVLTAYDWHGNVSELESMIERSCALSSGPVLYTGDLPSQIQMGMEDLSIGLVRVDDRPMAQNEPSRERAAQPIVSIADLEREAILNTIRQLHGDKLMAAKLLGIGKTTLYRKLKEYGIPDA